jgi:hypothetical protein
MLKESLQTVATYQNEQKANGYDEEGPWCPPWMDPRCRDWYTESYNKDHETMTELYAFLNSATNKLGISICAPLWG